MLNAIRMLEPEHGFVIRQRLPLRESTIPVEERELEVRCEYRLPIDDPDRAQALHRAELHLLARQDDRQCLARRANRLREKARLQERLRQGHQIVIAGLPLKAQLGLIRGQRPGFDYGGVRHTVVLSSTSIWSFTFNKVLSASASTRSRSNVKRMVSRSCSRYRGSTRARFSASLLDSEPWSAACSASSRKSRPPSSRSAKSRDRLAASNLRS